MERNRTPNKQKGKEILSVVEEELQVGKRTVDTGITRVTKKVSTFEHRIEEPLEKEQVEVEHVAVNRYIDNPVGVRTEGDLTIVPVMEEVLVVEKRLCLKEEIHIRRRRETGIHRQTEVLRKEDAVVEHEDLTH